MTKRKSTITILELPKRSQKISLDDISNIYGGCVPHHGECTKASDCCEVGGNYFTGMSCYEDYYSHKMVCFANYSSNWTI